MAGTPASSVPSAGGGSEIGYKQITAQVNIIGTSAATATTIITADAYAFTGAAVICQFYSPRIVIPAANGASQANFVGIALWEGATDLGQIAFIDNAEQGLSFAPSGQWPAAAFFRFAPTAASHTYIIKAYCSSTTGTPAVLAGAGGVGTDVPAFVRFSYAA